MGCSQGHNKLLLWKCTTRPEEHVRTFNKQFKIYVWSGYCGRHVVKAMSNGTAV